MPDQCPSSERKPAILIVDDEIDYLNLFRTYLESEYEVETAQTTAEADRLLSARPFDLIVADYMLPDEVGLELLIRVRQQYSDTKRVMVTGYLNPDLLAHAQSVAGLSDCLVKPVTKDALQSTLAKLLDL